MNYNIQDVINFMKSEAMNRQHFMLAAHIRQCEKQLEYLKNRFHNDRSLWINRKRL